MRILIIASLLLGIMNAESFGQNIKQPNVSGQFYPSNPKELSRMIDGFVQHADIQPAQHHVDILIVPHAGYIFSGPVAAYGYKAVSRQTPKTVVIIAPSHYYNLDGFAIWNEGGFQTPLGEIEVDQEFADRLLAQDQRFVVAPQVFQREHSLEVELPFLQKTFHDFKIVPVIAGQPGYELTDRMADSLDRLIGQRKDVLVVISTDMSHFYTGDVARSMDHRAIQAVKALNAREVWQQGQARGGKFEFCGFVPVTTALLMAQKRHLQADVLKYANSGDITGDNSRVVGYFTAIFYGNPSEDPPDPEESHAGVKPLSREEKKRLIEIARQTIDTFVGTGRKLDVDVKDKRLKEVEGAFVTVNKHGQLRGCIGNIIGRQPLYWTVRDMAVAAVSQDPRFNPVTPDELKDLEIEVSVLSQPWPIKDPNKIVMGVHGVIVSQGLFRQGVFLPQVATETGWTREQFLSSLCAHKAGLPPDCWKDPRTKIEIFTADVFSEKDVE